MVAGLGSVVSGLALSGASPLPQGGRGLAPDEAVKYAANQPANNQTPVAAEAAPATRTNGAAAAGRKRTTA
ncbi:hypothetical protein cym2001_07320 [Pseudomonas sp. CYM-20-01]|nr:hypothetical protein cym2001_07320 [Pseudomonas sp. CYM-20-01]